MFKPRIAFGKFLSCMFACMVFVFGGMNTANADTPTFSVTTTNLAADSTFQFSLSAAGTFTVDCGDGGVLSGTGVSGNTITRSSTTATTYTCTWADAGVHTIGFDGTATGYNTSTSTAAISFYNLGASKIASVAGNLSTLFPYMSGNSADGAQPRFYQTFYNATNLTTINDDIFDGYITGISYMFSNTFYGCTGLTSLPNGMFSNITTGATYMFAYTFYGCTGLTSLPSDLFSNITTGASNMFEYTFSGCTGLTSLPDGIFSNITTGAYNMFADTFYGCTGLTSLPNGIFSNITNGAPNMFAYTFSGCTGLTSLPNGMFSNITSTSNDGYYMFNATFIGCTGLTTLPSDLFSKITSGAIGMFHSTFSGCTGLTSLPNGIFSNITNGAPNMFAYTFSGCTGLTSLPNGIFSNITTGASSMFDRTFYNCTNLGCETAGCSTGTGYIPPTLFAGITPRGSIATSTMSNTFYGTKLVETCPARTEQYITGWEGSSTWNNKVSCVPLGIPHNITYVMDDGNNYVGAPTTYDEGTGATIDGIPTKNGYTFAGWCTDSELQNCAMSQTIGTNATTDQTFYAKWTQCAACNATNASCELSVVNNVCTYTTSCNEDYGNIQNADAYNVSCSACTPCDATNASCEVNTVNNVCTYTTSCNEGYGNIQNADAYNVSCSACTPCATTNASCEISTVNNVCTYTTSCNSGYGNIQDNGAYNASCSEVDFYNVTYSCSDGAGGTAPTDSTNYESGASVTTVTTANNTCTKAGNTFTGWLCGGNSVNAGSTFTISGDTTCTAQWSECTACTGTGVDCNISVSNNTCVYTTSCNTGYGNITNSGAYNASCTPNTYDITYDLSGGETCSTAPSEPSDRFTITTTNLSSGTVFNIKLSPKGNFVIDCGENGVLSGTGVSGKNVTRSTAYGVGASQSLYKCTYSTGGVKTITISGMATGYYSGYVTGAINFEGNTMIQALGGSLSAIFPNDDVYNHANDVPSFNNAFKNCTNLTYVSPILFSSYTHANRYQFQNVFNGCTNLGCETAGCSTGTGYIPSTMFAGLTASGSPTAANMWTNSFSGTKLVTTCPAGTTSVTTGYESTWRSNAGRAVVACEPTSGSSGSCGENYNNAPTSYTYGTGATINGTPTREGYVFVGWCTDEQLQNCSASQTIDTTATGNKTFYAKWIEESTETYNVTYVCGTGTSGTAPTDSTDYASGATVTTVTTANNTCTKTGNTFTGWSCGGNSVAAGNTFTISDDTTCTAQWSECTACTGNTGASCTFDGVVNNTCTYTTSCNTGYSNIINNGQYNASCSGNVIGLSWNTANADSGGTGGGETCTYGTPIILPTNPTKAGYKFVGWSVVTSGGSGNSQSSGNSGNNQPSGFDLSTLSSQVSTNGSSMGYIYHDGTGNNQSRYNLTEPDSWGTTFSYGKVRGESRCSTTGGTTNTAGSPGSSTSGRYCWCRAMEYQESGQDEWQEVSSKQWVFNRDVEYPRGCEVSCAYYCGQDVMISSDFRRAIYGIQ